MKTRANNGRVTNSCRQCGKDFTQPASRQWRDRFCSSECGNANRREKYLALVMNCATCGKEFRPRPTQVLAGGGKFCSQRCNTAGRAAANSPSAREKCVARRKENIATGATVLDKGERHWRWRGGSDATRRRRTESGKQAESIRKYRAAHPEKVAEWQNSRRGIGRVPKGAIGRLRVAQKDTCAYCGCAIPPYHVDHKLPVSRGGTNAEENLHLTCPRCNLRKSAMTHEEFLVSKRRPVKREDTCSG